MATANCPFCGGVIEHQYFDISGNHHFNCDDCGAVIVFKEQEQPHLVEAGLVNGWKESTESTAGEKNV